MSRPIIGRDWHRVGRTYRTTEAAFGTPFVVKKRRMPTIDEVIGASCGVIVVGIVAAWLAGVL